VTIPGKPGAQSRTEIGRACRKAVVQIASGKETAVQVTPDDVRTFLASHVIF